MKQIWLDLKSQLKEDFSWKSYGIILSLTALMVYLSYGIDIEKQIYGNSSHAYLIFHLIFYPAFYYLLVWIKAGNEVFRSKEFLLLSFIYLFILSLNTGFLDYTKYLTDLPLYERFYIRNIISNAKGTIIMLGGMSLVYLIWERKNLMDFYGLTFKNHDFKPYFILLLMMIPLIAAAATQADFLQTYPSFKPWKYQSVFGLSTSEMAWIFEGFYLFDFVRVEALFRGALVIGLARFLGKDSVLTMAALYCVFHFNKPLGETISSLFGGYLLGVIALRQGNIIGGCIVHIGIAGLMNLAAHLAYFIK